MKKTSIQLIWVSMAFILVSTISAYPVYASEGTDKIPTINDPNLEMELVADGLELPTSMAFLGPDDILVLEKNKGTVQRIINGTMLPEPLLDVNVGSANERGMLGIAIAEKHVNGSRNETSIDTNMTHVFLYFTESKDGDNKTIHNVPTSNRLYRYELQDSKLVNPELLLGLSVTNATVHNGGKVAIGPDKNVYTVVGDYRNTKAKNIEDGLEADGTSGIQRVTQDGQIVDRNGILGDEHPLDMYYAYGIRNSFGFDFDPVTGNLWDSENGPTYGDEINLVEPGFNSGWEKVQGVWEYTERDKGALLNEYPDNLVDFDGRGNYSSPEFVWEESVGVTALTFLDTQNYGVEYENDLLVADINNGNIYHFELNPDRTELAFNGILEDKVLSLDEEIPDDILFGQDFRPLLGGITDLKVGPDGYLYVLTFDETEAMNGAIYKIISNHE